MYRDTNTLLVSQRKRLKDIFRIVLAGIVLGCAYPVLAKELNDPVAMLNGFLIGFLGGLGIALHQDYRIYSPRIRKMPFTIALVIVVTAYTVLFAILILGVIGLTRGIESGAGFVQYILGDEYRDFIVHGDFSVIMAWALGFSVILSFHFQMRTKIAGNILHNMVFGTYLRPREEERLFMSIDLNRATTIAEKLGEDKYFRYLNDFFAAITPAIVMSDGIIYRYVGDQVSVSWILKKNFAPSRCIGTVFHAEHLLESHREYFFEKYGTVPSFKAALHCGEIVVGELGDIKSQLVYHGDVMYETELIEKKCKEFGKSLLISEGVLEMINLPSFYQASLCGDLAIRDKHVIKLYTVEEQVVHVPA